VCPFPGFIPGNFTWKSFPASLSLRLPAPNHRVKPTTHQVDQQIEEQQLTGPGFLSRRLIAKGHETTLETGEISGFNPLQQAVPIALPSRPGLVLQQIPS